MIISRFALRRNHGTTTFVDSTDKDQSPHLYEMFSYDENSKSIEVMLSGVVDYDSEALYQYRVYLDFNDIARIINALSDEGIKLGADDISAGLAPAKEQLLRLAMCAHGYEARPPTNG